MPPDDVTTNKSPAALLRESELEIAASKQPPIDLRTVPVNEWDKQLERDVTLPEPISHLLRSIAAAPNPIQEPFDRALVHRLEQEVEQFHSVRAPYYIYMSVLLQQTGRPWKFVPDAGPYLTGFSLGKK